MTQFRRTNLFIIIIALLFAPVIFAGDVQEEKEEAPIKIGVVVARTGNNAVLGKYFDLGSTLAVEEINANGGVLGRKLELVTADNKGIPVEAVNTFRKVISGDKVDIIIGCCMSSNTLAAMPVAQEAKIPQLTMSLNPKITQQGNPFIFRLQPTDVGNNELLSRYYSG